MNKKKLCRVARYFSHQASQQQRDLRAEGYTHYRDGNEGQAAIVNHQVDELQSIIDGLGSLMWSLGGSMAIASTERTASRLRTELCRYLADLHLDKLDEDVATASTLYAARAYVQMQRQPSLSIFEDEPMRELQPA